MRREFLVLSFGLFLTALGCGSKEYALPEIDEAQAKAEEEKINKAMEEEMERQMSGKKKKN